MELPSAFSSSNENKMSDGGLAAAGRLWRALVGVNGVDCQAVT